MAANNEISQFGKHYNVPGIKIDGQNLIDGLKVYFYFLIVLCFYQNSTVI